MAHEIRASPVPATFRSTSHFQKGARSFRNSMLIDARRGKRVPRTSVPGDEEQWRRIWM